MFKTGFRIGGLFDGLEPVLGSDFEHSYIITCSKRGSEFAVLVMVCDRFWDRFFSSRI